VKFEEEKKTVMSVKENNQDLANIMPVNQEERTVDKPSPKKKKQQKEQAPDPEALYRA
jgi:hypothetical protein